MVQLDDGAFDLAEWDEKTPPGIEMKRISGLYLKNTLWLNGRKTVDLVWAHVSIPPASGWKIPHVIAGPLEWGLLGDMEDGVCGRLWDGREIVRRGLGEKTRYSVDNREYASYCECVVREAGLDWDALTEQQRKSRSYLGWIDGRPPVWKDGKWQAEPAAN
jgi:hypothetical protein